MTEIILAAAALCAVAAAVYQWFERKQMYQTIGRMLAKEGLRYGIYSSLVILVLYAVVQRVLYYFMVHVYLYLHPNFRISGVFLLAVIALNLAICVTAVLLSGRQILKEDIVREIR